MTRHIEDEQRIINLRDDQDSQPHHDAVNPILQPARDSMIELVRQGLDTSLRSVQVWSDLARQVNPSALGATQCAKMASLAHDPLEELLAAQREVVGELVATQRQLTQQVLYPSATVSDDATSR